MSTRADGQPACGFCEGSGLWADPDGDPADVDPCPLCDGSGMITPSSAPPPEEIPQGEAPSLARLLAILPRLSQEERQRLYEELYRLYDCRIYRG